MTERTDRIVRPETHQDSVQRVLVVEDDPVFAKLLTTFLRQSERPPCSSVTAGTMQDALRRLSADSYDVIITDLRLPDSKDYQTVESLQRAAPNIPIVVLTGTAEGGIGSSLEAVRRGAAYFLRKGNVDAAAVERGIRYARDRSHLRSILGGDAPGQAG